MMSTSNNFTTDFRGSNGGVRFDDTPASEVLSGSFISKIIIQHLTYIYSFEVVCSALRDIITGADWIDRFITLGIMERAPLMVTTRVTELNSYLTAENSSPRSKAAGIQVVLLA